jgi:hypothetical protein
VSGALFFFQAFQCFPDRLGAGLPDGTFLNQKSKFGLIMEGLGMKKVGVFYEHLEYIRPFGIFYGHLTS